MAPQKAGPRKDDRFSREEGVHLAEVAFGLSAAQDLVNNDWKGWIDDQGRELAHKSLLHLGHSIRLELEAGGLMLPSTLRSFTTLDLTVLENFKRADLDVFGIGAEREPLDIGSFEARQRAKVVGLKIVMEELNLMGFGVRLYLDEAVRDEVKPSLRLNLAPSSDDQRKLSIEHRKATAGSFL